MSHMHAWVVGVGCRVSVTDAHSNQRKERMEFEMISFEACPKNPTDIIVHEGKKSETWIGMCECVNTFAWLIFEISVMLITNDLYESTSHLHLRVTLLHTLVVSFLSFVLHSIGQTPSSFCSSKTSCWQGERDDDNIGPKDPQRLFRM
jgi:hypothetical protein